MEGGFKEDSNLLKKVLDKFFYVGGKNYGTKDRSLVIKSKRSY